MSRCECAGCGLLFTGVSAFDRHQAWERDGTFTGCLDPAEVRRGDGGPRFSVWHHAPDGRPVWGRGLLPGEDPDARSALRGRKITASQPLGVIQYTPGPGNGLDSRTNGLTVLAGCHFRRGSRSGDSHRPVPGVTVLHKPGSLRTGSKQ